MGKPTYKALEKEVKNRTIALELTTSLLQASLESTTDGILIIDRQENIVNFNQKFKKMWRLPKSVLKSKDDKKAMEFVLDQVKNPKSFLEIIYNTNRNSSKETFDVIDLKDGRIYERYSFPQKVKSKIVGTVISFRNITERRKTSETLRLSEEKYRTLTENINIGIFRTTPGAKGKIIEANIAMVRMFGYKNKKEFLKLNASDLFKNAKDRAKLSRKLIKIEYVNSEENEFIRKDGSTFIGSGTAVVTKDETGKARYFEGVIEDITERKEAERFLLEAKNYLDKLHNSISDAVIAIKIPEREIVYANNSIKEVYGYEPEECLGRTTEMFYKNRKAFLDFGKKMERLFEQDETIHHETQELKKKNGQLFLADVKTTILKENGKVALAIGIVRDVTEKMRIEATKQVLYEISKAVNSTANLDELYKSIHKSLGSLIDMTNFSINLYDKETDEVIFPYYVDPKDKPVKIIKLKDSRTKICNVIISGKPLLISEKQLKVKIKKGILKRFGTMSKCWLGVPLKVRGNVIGAMAVWSYDDPNKYSKKDIELMEFVSAQVATAIENKRSEEALRLSEERFKTIFEYMNEGVLYVDNDGIVQYVNDKHCRIVGYKRNELIGMRHSKLLVDAKNKSLMKEKIKDRLQGISEEYAIRIKRKTGEERLLLISGAPIRNADGEITGSVGICTDITERKKAEEALLESEEKFKTFFENASIGMIITELNGNFLNVNETLCKMLGYKKEELLSKTFFEITHPDDAKNDTVYVKELINGKIDSIRIEKRYFHKNGSIVWINLNASVVCDENNKPLYFLGQIEDITKHKKIKEALKESEAEYHNLFNSMREGFALCEVICDEKGKPIDYRFLKINPAFGDQTGLNVKDTIGKTVKEIFPDIEKYWIEKYGHVAMTLEPMNIEDFNHNTNKWYDVAAFSPSKGKFAQLVRDITERKVSEIELKKLSGALEQTADHILITDKEGIIEYVNPAFEKMTGFKKKEVLGKTPRILKSGQYSKKYYEKLWNTILAGKIYRAEMVNKKKNGELYYEEKTITPLKDPEGNITHYLSTGKDVTERKKAEELLRNSKESLVNAQRIARLGNWDWDIISNDLYWSDEIYRIFGLEPQEFGATYEAFLHTVHPDDRDYVQNSVISATEDKKPYSIDHRIVLPNGEVKMVHEQAEVIFNDKGKPVRMSGTVQDITARKKIEEQLRLSEEKFRTIYEKGPVGIALFDKNGKFVSVNDMYCNLLGYSKDELLKFNFIDLTHKDDKAVNINLRSKMQKGDIESYSIEKRYIKKDGEALWVSVIASLIRGKDGSPLYSMGFIEDITERRLLEKKRDEAVKLTEKAARLTALGTMAAGISHEINQPLTAIKLKVDGMLYWKDFSKEISSNEVKDCLEFVSAQSTRIDDIIKQMRVLAKQDKNFKPVDVIVNSVIRKALALVKQQMSARGIKLELKLAKKMPRLKGHPGSIQQVIINLVLNAMYALENVKRKNKKIIITTGSFENNFFIEISDNGPGIPKKHIKHIFDPFFSTKKGGEGMGLGLSITDNIVTAYGGTISAQNKDKGGAQFTIVFPASN